MDRINTISTLMAKYNQGPDRIMLLATSYRPAEANQVGNRLTKVPKGWEATSSSPRLSLSQIMNVLMMKMKRIRQMKINFMKSHQI